jgi:NhaC family Na+:H+ antiporter
MSKKIDAVLRSPGNPPALWQALLPVIVLIGLLILNVYLYSDNASYGPNQIALLASAVLAGIMGYMNRVPIKHMLEGINKSLGSAIGAMLILLLVGALAGTWMMSGIIPAMIYYGLQVLNPTIFLFAAVIVCAIVSVATGSSWSTVATVGVALLGIGNALGINTGMIVGAIISGAYFGDKISPLSDTTNLAPAMAGTDLFTHIRYMLYTTVPSILITLVVFLMIGFMTDVGETGESTAALNETLQAEFNLTPLLFLVPAAVVIMVILKFDAVVALFIGTMLGAVFAVIFQPQIVTQVATLSQASAVSDAEGTLSSQQDALDAQLFRKTIEGDELTAAKEEIEKTEAKILAAQTKLENAEKESYVKRSYLATVNSMFGSVALTNKANNEDANELLKSKGMEGMLNTIWLIVMAMCFGGVMEACGLLKRITDPLVTMAKSDGALVATTAGSCMFTNLTASDQYLSIVVPGRMFRETYAERGLAPENLSRTLEDSGTVTSTLVPWNTCAAYHSGVLEVSALAFAPFCFFNILSPFMTVAFAFLGIKIRRLVSKDETPEE